MIRYILFVFSLLLASDQMPGPKQSKPILLKGGTLHPITSSSIISDIIFKDGKISKIGKNLLSNKAEVIDVTGLHIYPGFISASTTLGLVEINAVRASEDHSEVGKYNPNVHVERAYNPDSELIPITRSNGVLSIHLIPKSGRISGTSAVMRLDGWTWEDCIVQSPTGIHINWPWMTIAKHRWEKRSAEKQREDIQNQLKDLNDFFDNSRYYLEAKDSNDKIDIKFESMIPLLERQIPAFIHANRIEQIESAIYFAKEQKINMVIVGGADSWMASDLLKENNIPVIYEHPLSTPIRRGEAYDIKYVVPKMLYEAGVKFCISASSSTFEAAHQRSLPYEAAMAISYGLPLIEGLKSITSSAAEILGVDEYIGSLEKGKSATIFISDGDPLLFDTKVLSAYIDGRKVDMNDRHKMLRDKYLEKYKQLNIIE